MAGESRRVAVQLDAGEREHELIGIIRHKFGAVQLRTEQPGSREKVVTRNDTNYVLFHPDKAKKNYDRRQDLLGKGFFSPVNRPFKTVGRLESGNVDLLSSWLSAEEQAYLKAHWSKRSGKKSRASVHANKLPQEMANREGSLKPQAVFAPEASAGQGYRALRGYLMEMASVRLAVRTGRPLASCLRQQDKDPSLMKRLIAPRSSSQRVTSDVEGMESMSMNPQVLDPKDQENLLSLLHRKQNHLQERLRWIHMVLCGISNMRNKDLQTMMPLSRNYVSSLMKDAETAHILLKDPLRCSNPLATRGRLMSLVPEDSHGILPDAWEAFIHDCEASEPHSASPRNTGCKTAQAGLRRKSGQRDLEGEALDMAPWFPLLLTDHAASDRKPPKPKEQTAMQTFFLDAKTTLDEGLESCVRTKRRHREERLQSLHGALLASRQVVGLSRLLSSLRGQAKEPPVTACLWVTLLKKEVRELVVEDDPRFQNLLEKISQFHTLISNKKERFCLLVLSLPARFLLLPVLQEALLFLMEHVLHLPPQLLQRWYQHLRLPLTVSTATPP